MRNLSMLLFLISAFTMAQIGTDAPWMQSLLTKKSSEITYDEIKAAGDAYWQTHDKDRKGSGYKPYMRWISQAEAYVKPDGTLQSPEDIENAMNSFKGLKSSVDNSNWMPAGPFTVQGTGSWSTGQGRANSITVDPNDSNTYYIGTPGGGVWKSTDAGVNWTPLSDFLTEIGVSAVAIDPTNSNVIYIGTGDDDGGDTAGFGMLKSLDGGQTWNPTGLSLNGDSINEIYIDPTDNNTLYISSSNGFYRSFDGGNTVTRNFPVAVDDIKLKPGDPNIIYLSTPNGFFRSTNRGQTFTPVNGLPSGISRIVIAVTPANPNYVYLLIVDTSQSLLGIYRSNDSGATFTRRDTGVDILESPQAWFDLALEASPTNAELIYTGCLNVWRSLNGGSSFSKLNSWSNPTGPSYTHADIHQIRHFGNEVFAATDGGIYRSSNFGNNFTDLTATAQIGQFYRIAVSKQSSADMIGGLQDNGGQARSGNQWKNFYGADGMDGGIDPNNPNIRFGFIQNGGGLYFTSNGGNSLLGSISAPASGNWITPLKVDNAGTIYAGYNRLYKVQGNSFVAVSNSFNSNIDVLEIDPSDDNTIYVAVNSQLFKSTDAGVTFNNIVNMPNNITSVEVSYNDSNIIYVATRFSSGQVFRSNNGGASFSNITANLPNLGKNALVSQPNSADNEVYLGTTRGVYKFSEATNQWIQYSNNLPNVNIRDLEINPVDNILTAATYGRGIWQTAVTAASPSDDIGFVVSGGSLSSNDLCSTSNVEVTVINNGTNDINSFSMDYSINGGLPSTNNYNVLIPPQGTYDIILSNLSLSIGTNTIDFDLTLLNDAFASNNSQTVEVDVNNDGVINDVFGFETRPFLTENDNGNTSIWERGVPAGTLLNQSANGQNAYVTNLDGNYRDNSIDYLYTGCYDLVGVVGPILQFDMAFAIETDWDLLYMEYSVDNGVNWNILGSSADPNWYNSNRLPNGTDCFNCVGAQWTGFNTTISQYSYDLSAFNNEPSIAFRFVMHTDQFVTEEGALIDNFVVNGTLSNDDLSIESSLRVYPNPSDAIFNLQWDGNADFDYHVYDVSGKLIKSRSGNTGAMHQLDLSGVSKGMYFLNITSGDQRFTEKLLVR